jgi:hypothetical protein
MLVFARYNPEVRVLVMVVAATEKLGLAALVLAGPLRRRPLPAMIASTDAIMAILYLIALVATGVGGTAQAQVIVTVTQPGGNVIPMSLFGMTYFDVGHDWPNPPIISTGSEAKGVRVSWNDVQPDSACSSVPCGAFNWRSIDERAAAAAAHGVDYFYDFDVVPLWASVNHTGATMANLTAWDTWVTALAQRYDGTTGHGRILIYELWNEPDRSSSWNDTIQNLAVMAVHAVKDIRANDAVKGIHSLIDTPSGGPGFLTQFVPAYLAAGGSLSDFDAVSFHAYHSSNVCYGWPVPCAEAVLNDISDMRSAMATVGLANLPLWNTEGGTGTDSITDTQKAAHVARWYLLHWSAGVTRMMWYAADSPDWSPLFIRGAPTPTPNQGGVAYNQVYSWMVGSMMSQPCAQNGAIFACGLLTSTGAQEQAVWNINGSSSYSVPAGYGHYKDVAGKTNTISGGTLTIGIAPILLVP